jgi:RHS repeat-associated protein
LVGVSGPGSVAATFGRDGRNRDVKRTINGTTTYLIYDGWNLVAEYDATGVLATRYIHGPQLDEILAKVTTASTTFPLPDALGSTIAVTDASGAVVERVYYSDAFGTPTFKDASGTTLSGTSTGTRFLFTGREWLATLNLYDYRNRTYSAELGRFSENDPIRFKAGDVNLYRFVANNPVNGADPLGLWQHYGNWGGPGWTNGTDIWGEDDNFPRSGDLGYRPPIDARDQEYYFHDTCLRECARIHCPSDRQKCRKQCDLDLAAGLEALGGKFGNTWFEERIFRNGFMGQTPGESSGNWSPF